MKFGLVVREINKPSVFGVMKQTEKTRVRGTVSYSGLTQYIYDLVQYPARKFVKTCDLDISPKFILGLLKWLFCPLYTWEVL